MSQPLDTLIEATAIAQGAAREAGSYLLAHLGHSHVEKQKSPKDDLLDVDLEAERIILGHLRERAPQYGILSEEVGRERAELADYWLVDPVDGSANYQHGSSLFGITIALVVSGQTQAGIIYLPAVDEMYVAVDKGGSTRNGAPIHVSATDDLNDAMVHVGDFSKRGDANINDQQIQEMAALANRVRRVRMVGSAAVDLAFVACGRADALINHSADPWDVEAGRLLVNEAGGRANMALYNTHAQLAVYGNSRVQAKLSKLLASTGQGEA